MGNVMRSLRGAVAAAWALALISCGGGDGSSAASGSGSGSATAPNVASVIVDGGPTASSGSVNTLFTSVTFCVPGSTTQCQTIDHIQVDTGSYGLRVLAPVLALSLPSTQAADGNALLECTQFVDGYSWGPVALADVQIAGETAASVPVQVIGDANFTAVPDDCSSPNPHAEDTVATFGANGILGIGVFERDCAGCDSNAANGFYYSCPQTGACKGTTVPLAGQVANPVPLFATDNNGTLISLPSVAAPGEAAMTGSLIFGIDTQTNNASGTQSVLTVDKNGNGTFTIVFKDQTFSESFIDSGSNGIYFNDSNDGALPPCPLETSQPDETEFSNFYCPSSTQNLSATLTGLNAVSVTEGFSVGNAETMASSNPTYAVLPALAGTYSSSADTFDWGLPFYYGRRVATAIENHATAVNTGPYIAF